MTATRGRKLIATIGIDRYVHWPRLSNAVRDATGAAKLFGELGFEHALPPLFDERATGRAIDRLVKGDLRKVLGPEDSLVLFYAGHGGTQKHLVGTDELKTGYLIPADAEAALDDVDSCVDIEAWLKAVSLLPARHILVILDACHSGIALSPMAMIKSREFGGGRDTPLSTLEARRSRRIITSALDNEVALDSGPVPGHSLFTGCLIEGLTHEIRPTEGHSTTGSELGLYLQKSVAKYPGSRQTPDYGAFALDNRGEMMIPLAAARKAEVRAKAEEEVRAAADRARVFTSANLYNSAYPPTESDELPISSNEIIDDGGSMPVLLQRPTSWLHIPVNPVVDELPFASASIEAANATEASAPVPAAAVADSSPNVSTAIIGEERPQWAAASGRDQHGAWGAFDVAGVQQRMRWIPPGTFEMGSPETEHGRCTDEWQHEVKLTRGYWIGETPVTQALWVAVMGDNPSHFSGDLHRPVEQVSWDDCQAFCERLNALVVGFAARLPTEAEWERACRGGTTGATWVGAASSRGASPAFDAIAWHSGNSGGETQPVKYKASNPYGLYDMLGNVSEWCADMAAESGVPDPYASAFETDPVTIGANSYRVHRGGSWHLDANDMRAAHRFVNERGDRRVVLGFRIAASAPAASAVGTGDLRAEATAAEQALTRRRAEEASSVRAEARKRVEADARASADDWDNRERRRWHFEDRAKAEIQVARKEIEARDERVQPRERLISPAPRQTQPPRQQQRPVPTEVTKSTGLRTAAFVHKPVALAADRATAEAGVDSQAPANSIDGTPVRPTAQDSGSEPVETLLRHMWMSADSRLIVIAIIGMFVVVLVSVVVGWR